MSLPITHTRLSKVSLVVGFLALLAGTLAAFGQPATGYELSIYAATPAAFWIGLGIALPVSLGVAFGRREGGPLRSAALVLGGLSVTTVVALPLVRGYYQFGGGDSLTHLGWTRDVLAGRLAPIEMLYPGVHTMTILVAEVLGIRLGHAQLIVVAAFVVVFFLFVALCVRLLGRGGIAVPVGVFSALLLLPNNNVSVHLVAHPITQSLLVLPLALYLLMAHASRLGEWTNRLPVGTPTGVLLGLVAVAMVLVHPQGALNLVAILVAVAVLQAVVRRYDWNATIQGHRPASVPAGIAIAAFLVWTPRHPRVQGAIDGVVSGVLSAGGTADAIGQRSSSLAELGGSVVELFAKLFLVSTVFGVLAVAVTAAWYVGWLGDRRSERNALLTYLLVSLVPLGAAFGVFFVASVTTQHFRYVGFLMVPITIVGALGIAWGVRRIRPRLGDRRVRVALVLAFLLLIPLPLLTVHSSPFIYQSSADVTNAKLAGTATAVETMDRDVSFAGIRAGPRREIQAIYGTVGARDLEIAGERAAIPDEVFATNLTTHYEDPRYVPVSAADYEREVVLYEGFRYPASGFEQLRTASGVDHVLANGRYDLYVLGNGSGA